MPTVMITDDSLFIRVKIAKLLARHGYETIQAEDGEQAVEVYRETSPDAVLMDVTMPHKNGLQALAEILQFAPEARIIMLTALAQKSVATTAVTYGAKDFLVKPIHPDQLITALDRVLAA